MSITVPPYDQLPIELGAPAGSAWGVFNKDGKRDALGTLNFITSSAIVAAKDEIQTVHYPHQARGEFYNGISYANAAELRTDLTLGIQAISDRGGILGRGVLLDFVRYAAKRGIEYDPLDNYGISLTQIKDMIAEEDLTIRQGDILIVRSGLSKWIHASTPASVGPWERNTYIGVDPTPELLEWVWNQNLGAVAGDAIAFESIPASDNSSMRFHEAALAGWGMNIGELFDLEQLSIIAERNQRWSFFITACPLNIKGAAATPANTLAIF
ncbi:hypothetical protein LCER1_G004378 [Lachnellula cervina]|uniref:Cyclase n=1 Tax=Lachnellula cervina TaxID=1316786 RepID=A0A7D8YPH7_9HELO|nr:hypothetical protein LCER1_G004378 [Lachnellula cervina]